jgi:hypothetical protein
MNKNINIIYIFIMGPKRKQGEESEPEPKSGVKTRRTRSPTRSLTPPLPPGDDESDSDATNIPLDEGSEEEEKEDNEDAENNEEEEKEEDAENEEEQLSQEEEYFFSQEIFQGNDGPEIDAIDALVDEVEASQSQGEFSQSQSQEIILAIESNGCEEDEEVVQEVQAVENRLINPIDAGERIAQLYLELLRSTGENIRENVKGMIEQLKLAIRTMMTSTTAKAMFEQINEHVVPLVRTVATTCVGYYVGSYLLRYIGGIMNYLLGTHTTITLISLGSAGVHIVYNVGTREGEALLDQAVAAVNANIETFLTGVSRIGGITDSTRETMRTHTLDAVRDNVQQAINLARGEYQETEMANIMSAIENLGPNDSNFIEGIEGIQARLNALMAPVEVANNNEGEDEDEDNENFGGKRVKRNKTKKTKAKKTVKRKAKKVKKTKKAKKAKKTKKAKST